MINVMQGDLPHQYFSYSLGAHDHNLLHAHDHHIHHTPLHGLCVCRLLSTLRSRSYLHLHHLTLFLNFLSLLLHHHCLHHGLLLQPVLPELFPEDTHFRAPPPKALSNSLVVWQMFSSCVIFCDNRISTHLLLRNMKGLYAIGST